MADVGVVEGAAGRDLAAALHKLSEIADGRPNIVGHVHKLDAAALVADREALLERIKELEQQLLGGSAGCP